MDSGQLQNTLKSLCKVMWDNNVTNPITYVTQISYLLFLKMLEEMDHEQQQGRAWLVPAQRIIDSGYNMTLSSLGLIEAETVEHAEPGDILASVAAKEERILGLIAEMQDLLEGNHR